MSDIILDGRRRESQLYFNLRNRYYWDIIKFALSAIYLAVILIMLSGLYTVSSELEAYIPTFTWGTLAVTLLILMIQIRNIIRYRVSILGKAEKIADKHARIG